ncbi:MAG: phage terminase large subunit [Sphaerochaetaceae bacterium]|nr:phage terminase large subunit [Sphaerochaetaceae bacterium]
MINRNNKISKNIKPKLVFRNPQLSRQEFHEQIGILMKQARERNGLKAWMRYMAKNNLFFLCVYILDMNYIDHDFGYRFCAEIDAKKWGRIWVCAREHFKSTLLTFASTIQDIINNPEIRVGIYSYNVTLATDTFLKQLKSELENNDKLKFYFDDIFYKDPKKESPLWTNEAITVKRKSRAREATVEGSGLVTGQKTGKHYTHLVYDDVMTPDSVKTAEMMNYTRKQWEMSLNTGSAVDLKFYVVGTFYAEGELYSHLIEEQICEPMIQPALDSNNIPVFLSYKAVRDKRKALGPDVWATQMMCSPKGARKDTFKEEWLKRYNPSMFLGEKMYQGMNIYVFVDPAGSLTRKRDKTAIWVIGLNSDKNYYVIDLIRDKLNLSGKKQKIFELHRTYNPKIIFYEKVGMQADIEAIEEDMERFNYRFNISSVTPHSPKNLRIEALQPLFESGRIYFPQQIIHENWEGVNEDMLASFIKEEYKAFPVCIHEDALDSLSMILSKSCAPSMIFPSAKHEQTEIEKYLAGKTKKRQSLYNPLSTVY